MMTSLTVLAAFVPAGPIFVGLMLVVGFGSLGVFPIYYSLNQELSAKNQGKIGGSLGFITWFILFLVHPVIGRLMDADPDTRPFIFATVGVLPVLGWTMIALFWGRRGYSLTPSGPRQ